VEPPSEPRVHLPTLLHQPHPSHSVHE